MTASHRPANLAVILGFGAAGCAGSLDTSLDGKECSATRQCLVGYVCSANGICVLPTETSSFGGSPAAEPRDGATPAPPAGAGGTRAPAPAGKTAGSTAMSSGGMRTSPQPTGTSTVMPPPTMTAMPPPAGPAPAPTATNPTTTPPTPPAEPPPPAPVPPPPNDGCASDRTSCRGVCIDPKTDPSNCSSCGMTCSAPANAVAQCKDGKCTFQCNGSLKKCDDACVDGHCEESCLPGFKICEHECVNTLLDPRHCGDCGKQCSSGSGDGFCVAGQCIGQSDGNDTGGSSTSSRRRGRWRR